MREVKVGQPGQQREGEADGGQIVVSETEAGQPGQPCEGRVQGGQAVVREVQDLQ